jgi:hypothetical protein
MGYIRKIITADEKILFITGVHWIYLVQGLFYAAVPILIGVVIQVLIYQQGHLLETNLWPLYLNPGFSTLSLTFFAFGLVVFSPFLVMYLSHEVGLTNQRVIHKKGLVFIQVHEVDLSDVRGENIVYGWFGWLLGYGRVRLDCRFVNDVVLPAISRPTRMVKICHTARKLPGQEDNTNKVIDPEIPQTVQAEVQQTQAAPASAASPPPQSPPPVQMAAAPPGPDMEYIEQTRRRANMKMKLRILRDSIKGSFKRAR